MTSVFFLSKKLHNEMCYLTGVMARPPAWQRERKYQSSQSGTALPCLPPLRVPAYHYSRLIQQSTWPPSQEIWVHNEGQLALGLQS